MSLMTPELAHRLERAEAQHLAMQVESYAQLHPGQGARVMPAAGGVAALTDAAFGRKLNHVTGFGLGAAVSEDELAALEATYAAHGLATEIDLCPYVDAAALQLLARRGYTVNAFSNTYVKPLGDECLELPAASGMPGVELELVTAANAGSFFAACVAGFSVQATERPRALLEALASIAMARADTRLYLARVDGKIAGSAGLGLVDPQGAAVAHLYIASSLPEYRGRGIQQALLQVRLAAARQAGFTLASITARPSNTSARNAQRAGFALAYTKSTFVKA
ncbi:MAG: GNAT family N-acetyltransferase [Pseudomonadota bacterium]